MQLRNGKTVHVDIPHGGNRSEQGHYVPLMRARRNIRELKGLNIIDRGSRQIKEPYRHPDRPPQVQRELWFTKPMLENKCQAIITRQGEKRQCKKRPLADSQHCHWHDIRHRTRRTDNDMRHNEGRRRLLRQQLEERRRDERQEVLDNRRFALDDSDDDDEMDDLQRDFGRDINIEYILLN
ncbi:hypothetical protein PoB_001207700, partial [Plakobranchus ocellatus]